MFKKKCTYHNRLYIKVTNVTVVAIYKISTSLRDLRQFQINKLAWNNTSFSKSKKLMDISRTSHIWKLMYYSNSIYLRVIQSFLRYGILDYEYGTQLIIVIIDRRSFDK